MAHIAFDKLLGMEFDTLQDALSVFRGISPRVSPTYEELDLLMSRVRPGLRIIDKADIDNLTVSGLAIAKETDPEIGNNEKSFNITVDSFRILKAESVFRVDDGKVEIKNAIIGKPAQEGSDNVREMMTGLKETVVQAAKPAATGVKVQIPIEGTDLVFLGDCQSDGSFSISQLAVREAYKHLSR